MIDCIYTELSCRPGRRERGRSHQGQKRIEAIGGKHRRFG